MKVISKIKNIKSINLTRYIYIFFTPADFKIYISLVCTLSKAWFHFREVEVYGSYVLSKWIQMEYPSFPPQSLFVW